MGPNGKEGFVGEGDLMAHGRVELDERKDRVRRGAMLQDPTIPGPLGKCRECSYFYSNHPTAESKPITLGCQSDGGPE